jgi:hypothetical protein
MLNLSHIISEMNSGKFRNSEIDVRNFIPEFSVYVCFGLLHQLCGGNFLNILLECMGQRSHATVALKYNIMLGIIKKP